jgi:hypothetical protein
VVDAKAVAGATLESGKEKASLHPLVSCSDRSHHTRFRGPLLARQGIAAHGKEPLAPYENAPTTIN